MNSNEKNYLKILLEAIEENFNEFFTLSFNYNKKDNEDTDFNIISYIIFENSTV